MKLQTKLFIAVLLKAWQIVGKIKSLKLILLDFSEKFLTSIYVFTQIYRPVKLFKQCDPEIEIRQNGHYNVHIIMGLKLRY